MSNKTEFVKTLDQWLNLNKLINTKQDEIKKLKVIKENHEELILNFIEKNNLKKNKFTMKGESIYYNEVSNPPSLSIKLIEEALEKILSKDQLDKIISIIKEKRDKNKKIVKVLKNKIIKPRTPRKKSLRKK